MEEAERICRCHNADGAMEYWLEPDELAALRREIRVDPYWVPPGWKRGDPVSADGYALKAKMRVEELSKELAGLKRILILQMWQLLFQIVNFRKRRKKEYI
ncbi:protein AMEIOTIC 1 homolog [Triticum aestivum]|uniref:protein AMEIOTIC 1 homolog n=1 Tax=Triticum aestivum TaxID=4565 RepID=UPI001D016413|nr:protein AMEIOTIC 1 homolog [Triticum aestivum]